MSYSALLASCEYLCYGSTVIINILILSVRGPSLFIDIRQNLTSDYDVWKVYSNNSFQELSIFVQRILFIHLRLEIALTIPALNEGGGGGGAMGQL